MNLQDELVFVSGQKETLLAKLQSDLNETPFDGKINDDLKVQFNECKKAEQDLNKIRW